MWQPAELWPLALKATAPLPQARALIRTLRNRDLAPSAIVHRKLTVASRKSAALGLLQAF